MVEVREDRTRSGGAGWLHHGQEVLGELDFPPGGFQLFLIYPVLGGRDKRGEKALNLLSQ